MSSNRDRGSTPADGKLGNESVPTRTSEHHHSPRTSSLLVGVSDQTLGASSYISPAPSDGPSTSAPTTIQTPQNSASALTSDNLATHNSQAANPRVNGLADHGQTRALPDDIRATMQGLGVEIPDDLANEMAPSYEGMAPAERFISERDEWQMRDRDTDDRA